MKKGRPKYWFELNFLALFFKDDIIKDQKKLKKKALKKKTQQTQKKGTQQQLKTKQGNKGTSIKQNQRRRIAGKNTGQSAQQRQGAQGRNRPATRKQKGQVAQQRQGSGNQSYKKNQNLQNKGRPRGAKVAANRLKNKQSMAQKVHLSFFFCSSVDLLCIKENLTVS